MLDFRNFTFSSPKLCMRAIMPPNSKFRLNRTLWSQVIAKNDIQYGVRPPSWIWEFLKFRQVSFAWVKICVCIPNFFIFGRLAAEIWRYNDFQNGGRPPCWIYCDVIMLYRKTEFNALDIVLNFDVHRFHIFWYTSTIMFKHFSLKLYCRHDKLLTGVAGQQALRAASGLGLGLGLTAQQALRAASVPEKRNKTKHCAIPYIVVVQFYFWKCLKGFVKITQTHLNML